MLLYTKCLFAYSVYADTVLFTTVLLLCYSPTVPNPTSIICMPFLFPFPSTLD